MKISRGSCTISWVKLERQAAEVEEGGPEEEGQGPKADGKAKEGKIILNKFFGKTAEGAPLPCGGKEPPEGKVQHERRQIY